MAQHISLNVVLGKSYKMLYLPNTKPILGNKGNKGS